VARAAKPVEIVAACAVAVVACCRFRRRVRQPPQGKSQGVDDALWERGEFLLARFDGRTLAALREEGPPLIAPRAEVPAQPAVPLRLPPRKIVLTQRLTIAIAVASLAS
jgi:hypothetical protein